MKWPSYYLWIHKIWRSHGGDWLRKLMSSGMWWYVVWQKRTDVSDELAANIPHPNYGGKKLFWNVSTILPDKWLHTPEDSNDQYLKYFSFRSCHVECCSLQTKLTRNWVSLALYKQAKRERACGRLAKTKITSLRSDLRTEPMQIMHRCPNKSAGFNFVIKRIIYSKSADIFISVQSTHTENNCGTQYPTNVPHDSAGTLLLFWRNSRWHFRITAAQFHQWHVELSNLRLELRNCLWFVGIDKRSHNPPKK